MSPMAIRISIFVMMLLCRLTGAHDERQNDVVLQNHHSHHHHHHGDNHHHHLGQNYYYETSPAVRRSDEGRFDKMTEIDSDGRLQIYWTEPKDVFDVQLRYEGLAWLGVGFARRGRIKESAVVVVGEPGAEQVLKYEVVVATKGGRDEWSDARTMRDESQTLRDATFFQTEKTTTLSFQKLSEEEEDETPIRTTNDGGGGDNTTLLVLVGEGGRSFPASTETFVVSLNLFSDERAPSSNATTASPVAAPVKRRTERDILTKGKMLSIIGGVWGFIFLVFVLYQCFCERDYEEVEDFVPANEDRPLFRASSDLYSTRYRRE